MLANVRFVPLILLPGFAVLAVNVLTNLNSPETALVVGFIGMCVSIGLAIHDLELRYTILWSQKGQCPRLVRELPNEPQGRRVTG